jgi:hypothetical protein
VRTVSSTTSTTSSTGRASGCAWPCRRMAWRLRKASRRPSTRSTSTSTKAPWDRLCPRALLPPSSVWPLWPRQAPPPLACPPGASKVPYARRLLACLRVPLCALSLSPSNVHVVTDCDPHLLSHLLSFAGLSSLSLAAAALSSPTSAAYLIAAHPTHRALAPSVPARLPPPPPRPFEPPRVRVRVS